MQRQYRMLSGLHEASTECFIEKMGSALSDTNILSIIFRSND